MNPGARLLRNTFSLCVYLDFVDLVSLPTRQQKLIQNGEKKKKRLIVTSRLFLVVGRISNDFSVIGNKHICMDLSTTGRSYQDLENCTSRV